MILVANNENTRGVPATVRMLTASAAALDAIEAGIRLIVADERTRCAGLVLRDELYPASELLTDEASKVGALPQTPPGAEPLDLNTCARFR
jgi:hypothetical protein